MQNNKPLHILLPIWGLLLIFLVDVTLIVSTHLQWDNAMNKYVPLQNQVQSLKSDISKAHLWLEEAIGGDPYVDIEKDVMIPFQHQSFHHYLDDIKETFGEKEDQYYLAELEKIHLKLQDISNLAETRWQQSLTQGIGSYKDQIFDSKFKTILTMIDDISLHINKRLSNELADRKYYFSWILALFLLVNIVVFSMLVVAKRRQYEYQHSLAEEKERAVVTLGSIGDAVITTDINGNITFFNDIAEMLTGYKNEEVQGLQIDSVLNLYNTKTGKRVTTPISDVIHKGITKLISNGTKLVNKTGKEYILSDSAAPVKSKEGEILGTVLVFQNDTERHAIEEVLKKSEEKYRRLVENIKHYYFFYAHDMNGVFTYVSSSMTEVLGYTEEAFKTHYLDYLTDDPINDIVEKSTVKCMQGEQQKPYVISMYNSDGTVCYLDVSESPVFDDEGNVISIEGVARDITYNYLAEQNLKEKQKLLDYRAHYDLLTNLPNRQLFLDRLSQSIKKAERFDEKVAVLFIDLDHFKEINDSLGHHMGDKVLQVVSEKLQKQIRETDTLARLGGDEFILILDIVNDENIIVDIVQKLMDIMTEPLLIESHQFYVTLSIGITLYPNDGIESMDLLKNADAAMYKAKDDGRNTYCFYTEEMTEKAFERIVMETSLRQALEKEQFIAYYQPQFDGITEKIIGTEALIRWDHPIMGLVSPATFIPLAEEIGLIIQMDQWMMKRAMSQVVEWYKAGLNPGVLALNLSIKQLKQADFVTTVSSLLDETGCKPEWVAFEVTESQIMINPEHSILVLQELNDMGIELAIDDFGTGYSSLSYLKHLPINKLKIDQSFVHGLPDNKEDVGIAKALIILSQSLNLKIIAEGVETLEQKTFLIENGCTDIQGYYYAKPMPKDEIENMLRGFN